MASDYYKTLEHDSSGDERKHPKRKNPTVIETPSSPSLPVGLWARLKLRLGVQSMERFPWLRALVFLSYALLLPIPLVTGNYYLMRAGGTIGIYLILAAGLSIVAGQAGLLDLGYAGFYGIGAYVYALLASPQLGIHLPFPVAVAASIIAAMLAALAVSIPTLRLHGDYLAMVTLGFGQIVRILLNNMDRPINITNGPNGIVAIDPPRILGFTFASMESQYIFIWLVTIAVLIGSPALSVRVGVLEMPFGNETANGLYGRQYQALSGPALREPPPLRAGGALFASWQGQSFLRIYNE